MEKSRASALEQITRLFYKEKLCVLSTQKGGQPYASLVAFAASDDLQHLVFLTPEHTRKFEYLTACPKVALLVDSSRNRADDVFDAAAVTILGKAFAVSRQQHTHLLAKLLERHPNLKTFSGEPSTRMIKVDVDQCFLVSRFQDVTQVVMGPGPAG